MPGFSLSSLLAYIYPLHPLPNAGGLPEETLNGDSHGFQSCLPNLMNLLAGSETTNIESIIKSYLIQQGYKARPRSLNIKLKEALVKEIVSSGVHYDANDLYTIKITDLAVATAQASTSSLSRRQKRNQLIFRCYSYLIRIIPSSYRFT